MYHFLRVLAEKVYPNAFDFTRKIDQTKEQIIDFCPVCGEGLQDKRVITLINHQKQKHPKSDKELLKQFVGSGGVVMSLIMITILIIAGMMFVIGSIDQVIWSSSLSEEEKKFNEFCKNLVDRMPQADLNPFIDKDPVNLQKGDYVISNINDFKKCNYYVTYYSLGDEKERIEKFRESNAEP